MTESTILLAVLVVGIGIVFGLYTMVLAEKKGHSSGAWFAGGFFFNFIALIAAAGMPSNNKRKSEKEAGANRYTNYNFKRDEELTANVGADMWVVTRVRQNDADNTNHVEWAKTLTYLGKQGNIIRVCYREYSEDTERPTLTHELVYDLSDGPDMMCQDMQMRVTEATNSFIKFAVLKRPDAQ
jgi:hypothetical protein